MGTVLQRKLYFRHSDQFKEWCVNDFSLGFFLSSLFSIPINLTVYYPNLVNSLPSPPLCPLVSSIIYTAVAILFVAHAHMR